MILGSHRVPVLHPTGGEPLTDRPGHKGTTRNRERAPFTKIVLDVHDDECAHPITVSCRKRGGRRGPRGGGRNHGRLLDPQCVLPAADPGGRSRRAAAARSTSAAGTAC